MVSREPLDSVWAQESAVDPHQGREKGAVVYTRPHDLAVLSKTLDILSDLEFVFDDRQLLTQGALEIRAEFAGHNSLHPSSNSSTHPDLVGRKARVRQGADDDILAFECGGKRGLGG